MWNIQDPAGTWRVHPQSHIAMETAESLQTKIAAAQKQAQEDFARRWANGMNADDEKVPHLVI